MQDHHQSSRDFPSPPATLPPTSCFDSPTQHQQALESSFPSHTCTTALLPSTPSLLDTGTPMHHQQALMSSFPTQDLIPLPPLCIPLLHPCNLTECEFVLVSFSTPLAPVPPPSVQPLTHHTSTSVQCHLALEFTKPSSRSPLRHCDRQEPSAIVG